MSESRVSHVIDSLGVAHILISTRQFWEEIPYAHRSKKFVICNKWITSKKHECFIPYCPNCNRKKEVGHFCYMRPLKNELPCSDDVLFVFYNFKTTQDTKFSDKANVHVPILVCLQQFCTVCKLQNDIDVDCKPCGRRRHSFFEDPVGDLLSYLCEPRPWCKKVVAIAHNA
jgi:hypothetical protein